MDYLSHDFKPKPHLITRSLNPENQETPIHFLEEPNTPVSLTYRRNHFQYPSISKHPDYLFITGSVKTPTALHYNQIFSFPSRTVTALMECSGNKRALFEPKVYGEQWTEGAISQGKWRGVPLSSLLSLAGIKSCACEVVFQGKDTGFKKETRVHFERSLPIEKALDPDVIVAWEHNDRPLTLKHGFPFRLIVPGWYAMASVKWLTSIQVINHSFYGPFQTEDYVYFPNKVQDVGSFPVTTRRVNSIIQQPLDQQILIPGTHEITGLAWTGDGVITFVEISVDNGASWKKAVLKNTPQKYQWIKWSYFHTFKRNNEHTIKVRAVDSNGHSQPDQAFWNRKGYGYNEVSQIKIKMEG